ncbi:MAG: glycosyltransferase family 2 protein [Verrucomicrobia bacterium]|nr:glycosyltransferase family 2 protein [Verrucomicrobiota bacterium]
MTETKRVSGPGDSPGDAPEAAGAGAHGGVSIAVVTSNYNHARYLPEAIESVLAQSEPPHEFVIVDDCSTDNSVEVIERYARSHPVIRLIRRTRNQGGIRNINEALPTLRSSHFISLAADDRVLPGYFETVARLLEKYPQAGMCLCDYECFWNDGRREARPQRLAREASYFPPAAVPRVLYNRWPHGQSVVQLAALRAAGGYPADLRWHCDWFVSWAICLRHGFCYAPIVSTALRVSDSSYSGQGRRGEQQRPVLQNILQRLQSPEFNWLAQPLREANALSHFGPAILRGLLPSPEGRRFVTWRLLATLAWKSIYGPVARAVPRSMKRWLQRHVFNR